MFISSHAWPVAGFLSKMGMRKLSSMTLKLKIGDVPLFVPFTIINIIAPNNLTTGFASESDVFWNFQKR